VVLPFATHQPLPVRQRNKADAILETKLNVLVIDGAQQERRAVRVALEGGGFALQEAADAEHGLKLAGASTFDCILIDVLLPDATGLDVLECLRQPDGLLPCAVVMLTEVRTADIAVAVIKAGAVDYLATDRLDADTLRRAVRSAVRQFRLIDAQRAADRRNAQLAAIVAASDDAIISAGTDLIVQTWNAGAQRLFGYGEAEARGRALSELIIPDGYAAEHSSIIAAAMTGAAAVLKETVRRHKDGSLLPVEIIVSPLLDGTDRVTGFSAILRDIGERRRAQEVQARLAAIVTSSADAIISEALDGAVTSWNEAAERMFGCPAGEMIGRSARRLVPADRQQEEDAILARLARGESIERYEATRLAGDGRTFDASVSVSPLRDAEDRIIGVSKIISDITQRKRTEARLAEREAQLALFVEHAPAAIAMFDKDMICLAASRRFHSDYRVPENVQVIGVSHYQAFPEIPRRWRDVHARVLAGEELSADEDSFVRPDGRIDWSRWSMKPWRTPDGRIGGALLFTEVITAQVEARRALADSEARFRATFENAAVGIAHLAPDGRWLRVNEALCRILGYPADELLARSFQDVTHADDLEADLSQLAQMSDRKVGSYGIDKRHLRKDGTVVWCRRTLSCVRKSDGPIDYFVIVVEDITERKAHEEQIQLLMREVNHRAKNMLSLVQAIARQTAARAPEAFIERFTERIQALAANQDLLVRNEWRGVDIEDLVRAQLAHFADLVGARIIVRGAKLRLNAAAAQAIGLALHELATNAGKYGALSTDGGRVGVRWRREGAYFTMCWAERNGPPVSPPQRRGFGSTVMTSLAERSVGGRVHLDYAPAGLTWRLTCRASNVLEGRGRGWKTDAGGEGGRVWCGVV
jgi:PAS domain S-box-containing protein